MVKGGVVDSSVWIGLFLEFDTQHKKAIEYYDNLDGKIYLPYCVVNETSSVLTYKHSKNQADNFLKFIAFNSDIVILDSTVHEEISFFLKLENRISFTDASLLYFAKYLKVELVTLDKQLERIWKKSIFTATAGKS